MGATRPAVNRRYRAVAGLLLVGLVAPGPRASAHGAHDDTPLEVNATAETTPIPNDENAGDPSAKNEIDDMAIWVDPANPQRSVVIGTLREQRRLAVYDLAGKLVSDIDTGHTSNNVDIRAGFPFRDGPAPLVGVAGSGTISFYRLDPATRRLHAAGDDFAPANDPHGFCMYRSGTGFYAFGVGRSGDLEQYRLSASGDEVDHELVRTIHLEPKPIPLDASDSAEGCVADDEAASLFVAETNYYIWRYGAEPGDGAGTADRGLVEDGDHIAPQIEGLAIVDEPHGPGFLLASSQGDDTFNVYQRRYPYDFLRKVAVVDGPETDGCERTDGIDAVAAHLGKGFPSGMFVCQDNANTAPRANQNLKYVPLERVVALTAPPAGPGGGQEPATDPDPPADPAPADPGPPAKPKPPAGQPPGTPDPAANPTPKRSGYWMLGADGAVYPFGDARRHGGATVPAAAVDLEPTPTGRGYWILDAAGAVAATGDATGFGDATNLAVGERAVSLSAAPGGGGYWVFTDRGRVIPRGAAAFAGDMSGVALNGPVLDSIATPSGNGYFMVAADGGIFAFGDAKFYGSMGGTALNAPVQSLVPDPDHLGYWLVASDGGVFAFEAAFRGSMGGVPLNAPVTGMVPNGDGYLMVAEDGGIFNFSAEAFHGSLGADPPLHPIVAVAAL